MEARGFLRERLAELPVAVDVDEAGNLWAVLEGARPETVVVGSHVDSVPNGGWLDGALGVMAALEVLRDVAADGTPPVTVALVDWADEEGARFGRSLFGSSAAAGTLDPDAVRDLVDAGGERLEDVVREHGVELDRAHEAGSRPRATSRAYLELHIEQGPVLEGRGPRRRHGARHRRRRAPPGVFTGQAAHAGSTPIDQRRDSFLAAARFALELREVARRHDGVCTVGDAALRAGRRDRGPGRDDAARRPAPPRRRRARRDAGRDAHGRRERRRGGGLHGRVGAPLAHRADPVRRRARSPPPRAACREVAGTDRALPSGPLHDAAEMARRVPTVMIFSSSTNGLSHTKEEDTPVEHLELAARAYGSTARAAIDLCAARA